MVDLVGMGDGARWVEVIKVDGKCSLSRTFYSVLLKWPDSSKYNHQEWRSGR
jgi:hypothetical protein